jgi:hypothetical protein
MSFNYDETYKTIFATSAQELVQGLDDMFNLGVDFEKSFFGCLFQTHLVFTDGTNNYFYNREDLLAWIQSVVKTTNDHTENYLLRQSAHLKLADDCIIPEKIVKELEVEIEDLAPVVLEEFQDDSTEIKEGLFEVDEDTPEAIIEKDLMIESAKEQLPWKTMTGPKWSKQDILDEAIKFNIELDINLKKPELIESFKAAYNK